MIVARCINKIRNEKGAITKYVLEDQTGNSVELPAATVKAYINNSQMDIVNLTLTSDGRLVDKAKSDEKFSSTEEKEKYLSEISNLTARFIVKIITSFNDAKNEKIEVQDTNGKYIMLDAESKNITKIQDMIKQESLSSVRICLYNYEKHIADDSDDLEDYIEEEEDAENYIKELYGGYDEQGNQTRFEDNTRETNVYNAKVEVQQCKDEMELIVKMYEQMIGKKVLFRMTNPKSEGELAIILKGFR